MLQRLLQKGQICAERWCTDCRKHGLSL